MINNSSSLTTVFIIAMLVSMISCEGLGSDFNETQVLGEGNPNCSIPKCEACNFDDNTICDDCEGDLIFRRADCICEDKFYGIDQTTCGACFDFCQACTGPTSCTSCFGGYYDATTSCEPCSSNCISCTGASACTECEPNYQIDGGICYSLASGVGGTTTSNGTTIECSGGCVSCTDASSCTACQDGRYLNGQSTCSVCDTDCLTCQGSASNCTSCSSKFLLQENKCVTCSDPNCINCDPSSVCYQCTLGYGVSSNQCKPCSAFCTDCSTDATECIQCYKGYVIVDNQCVQCLSGCGVCDTNDFRNCISCNEGYYLRSSFCKLCPTGCATCSGVNACETCNSGYKLSGNKCVKQCQHPCNDCLDSNPNSCTSCFGGYSRSGTKCNPDLSCNRNSACTVCPRTYTLANSTCTNCDAGSNCVLCNPTDQTICTKCESGFYLQSSTCSACQSECLTCLTASYCFTCADGFYLLSVNRESTGICDPCSSDVGFCATCAYTDYQCLTCLDGYSLQGIKCISDIRIVFVVLLETDFFLFIPLINGFKRHFMLTLGAPYAGNPQWLTFNTFAFGSLKLNATITIPSNTSSASTLQNVTTSFDNNDRYNNVTILSYEATIEGDQQTPVDPPEAEANLGLILGLSIPLLLIILSLILIIKTNTGKSVDDDEDVIESNNPLESEKI